MRRICCSLFHMHPGLNSLSLLLVHSRSQAEKLQPHPERHSRPQGMIPMVRRALLQVQSPQRPQASGMLLQRRARRRLLPPTPPGQMGQTPLVLPECGSSVLSALTMSTYGSPALLWPADGVRCEILLAFQRSFDRQPSWFAAAPTWARSQSWRGEYTCS